MISENPNFWTIVSIIVAILVGIVAVGATLWVGRRQMQVKKIEYVVDSSEQLLSLDRTVRSGLQITFNGEVVEQLYSHSIRVLNRGNTAIVATDYADPLEIRWPDGFKLTDVTVGHIEPASMSVEIVRAQDHIRLPPIFLNPGDGYTVTLLAQQPERPYLAGRLVGGLVVKSNSLTGPRTGREMGFLGFCYVATALAFLSMLFPSNLGLTFMKMLILLVMVGISAVLTTMINMQREVRRWGRLSESTTRKLIRETEQEEV